MDSKSSNDNDSYSRALGFELPKSIDIHIPILGARITFPLDDTITVEGEPCLGSLVKEKIFTDCREALSAVPEYQSLIAHEIEKGAHLGLAWRRGMKLDWVWLENDVNDVKRDWWILFGLVMKQVSTVLVLIFHATMPNILVNKGHTAVQLDLRIASHSITKTRLTDGSIIEEPPSIEGYLYRLKSKTQARSNVYVVSHDGNLFTNSPSHAYPPPVPRIPVAIDEGDDNKNDTTCTTPSEAPFSPPSIEDDIRRGARQILNSSGYVDMRDILVVRRAIKPRTTSSEIHPSSTIESIGDGLGDGLPLRQSSSDTRRERAGEDFPALDPSYEEDSDLEDPGGDFHLSKVMDRDFLRSKRSFEVVMRSGTTVRFEVRISREISPMYAYPLCCVAPRLTPCRMVCHFTTCSFPELTLCPCLAIEWVKRLNSLIRYWTRKHRVDARVEMDLVRASLGKTPFEVPQSSHKHRHFGKSLHPSLPDPQASAESMSTFWNWCALDVCKPVIKAGKLFRKKARRKPFRCAL